MRTTIVVCAVLLLTATLVSADAIRLKSGTVIKGTVVKVTDTEVTIKLDKGGANLTLKLEKLSTLAAYEIRSPRIAQDDAKGHIALGDFCLEGGLLNLARSEYRKAGRIDPKLAVDVAKRLTAADQIEARTLYERAEAASKAGKHKQALDLAKKVLARYPASAWGAKARLLASSSLASMSKPKQLMPDDKDQQPKKSANNDPKSKQPGKVADPTSLKGRVARLYSSIKKVEKQGDIHNAEGLKADSRGSVSSAEREFKKAVDKYKSCLGGIRGIGKYTREAREIALFRQMADKLQKKIISTWLNAAHTMAGEKNWKKSSYYVEMVLVNDPANRLALKLRQKIEDNRIHTKASKLTNTKPTVKNH